MDWSNRAQINEWAQLAPNGSNKAQMNPSLKVGAWRGPVKDLVKDESEHALFCSHRRGRNKKIRVHLLIPDIEKKTRREELVW